jgi:UPF0716 family protein affecting phage T7 exclusion
VDNGENEAGKPKQPEEKEFPRLDRLDILAFIIAAFQVLTPYIIAILLGVLLVPLVLYYLLQLVGR